MIIQNVHSKVFIMHSLYVRHWKLKDINTFIHFNLLDHIDSWVQDCIIPSASAVESLESCPKPSIWSFIQVVAWHQKAAINGDLLEFLCQENSFGTIVCKNISHFVLVYICLIKSLLYMPLLELTSSRPLLFLPFPYVNPKWHMLSTGTTFLPGRHCWRDLSGIRKTSKLCSIK